MNMTTGTVRLTNKTFIQVCQKDTPRYLLLKDILQHLEDGLIGPIVQKENAEININGGYLTKMCTVFFGPTAIIITPNV